MGEMVLAKKFLENLERQATWNFRLPPVGMYPRQLNFFLLAALFVKLARLWYLMPCANIYLILCPTPWAWLFFRVINLMMRKWGEACCPKRKKFRLNFAPIKQISHFGNFPICPGGRRVYGALPTVKCTENRVGDAPFEIGPSSLVTSR